MGDGGDKAPRARSRWSVAMLSSLPGLGRSRSQERGGGGGLPAKMAFWKRKTANITDYDPTYRVVYLGNVLTGWAKGDGCVDKPLSTLWRNHISSEKADILMKVTVVGSGLRAVTKEHGLTEYWANRVTYCAAHPSYPRVFCWIYRHEGRKMKQELRCHAVLCPKEDKARQMAACLQDRLHQALVDFKKEKISRQNARLSLANCLQDNPSMPYRKLLLQTGTCNYKPPIERSKSAPKLTSIVEAEPGEEEAWQEACLGSLPEEEEEEVVMVHSPAPSLRVPRLPASAPPRHPPPEAILIFGEAEDGLDSEEEDEIKDYIGLQEEADSAASESPASQTREEGRLRGDLAGYLSGEEEELAAGLGKARVSGQEDTISDESGYSEEPGLGKEVTVVRVNPRETPAGGVEFLAAGEESEGEGEEGAGGHKLQIRLLGEEEQQVTITGRGGMRWSQPLSVRSPGSHETSPSPPPAPTSGPPSPRELVSTSPRDMVSTSLRDLVFTSPRDLVSTSPRDLVSTSPRDLVSTSPRDLVSTSPRDLVSTSPRDLVSTSPRDLVSTSPRDLVSTSPRDLVSTSPRITDLSVKSVLLSEFSAPDKMRYIERSGLKTSGPMVLNRQEFCINI